MKIHRSFLLICISVATFQDIYKYKIIIVYIYEYLDSGTLVVSFLDYWNVMREFLIFHFQLLERLALPPHLSYQLINALV